MTDQERADNFVFAWTDEDQPIDTEKAGCLAAEFAAVRLNERQAAVLLLRDVALMLAARARILLDTAADFIERGEHVS